jgi:hypothetical protein
LTDWEDCSTLKVLRELKQISKSLPPVVMIKAPPPVEEPRPPRTQFVDGVYLLTPRPRGKLTDHSILQVLRGYVDQYSPACEESVRRNKHMNDYDGTPIPADGAKAWLGGFSEHFASRYSGGRKAGDVMFGMAKCAKSWRAKPGLEATQAAKDALVVDFVNYVASNHCGMDLAMYTSDLGKPEPGDEDYA